MKILATNKNAFRNYEVLDKYEAGIVLAGCEVKSISLANCSINEAYISITNHEVYIINMHVAPFAQGNINNVDPYRKRKLLLHKQQIINLAYHLNKEHLTCIPLRVYWEKGHIKLEIAIAKGKKLYDKRADLKAKDDKRTIKTSY